MVVFARQPPSRELSLGCRSFSRASGVWTCCRSSSVTCSVRCSKPFPMSARSASPPRLQLTSWLLTSRSITSRSSITWMSLCVGSSPRNPQLGFGSSPRTLVLWICRLSRIAFAIVRLVSIRGCPGSNIMLTFLLFNLTSALATDPLWALARPTWAPVASWI